jgi:glycosyltransferase involved in cell wall biosynthesis
MVSFVIPTLNNIKTIGKCIKSINTQTYHSKEVIVIDGYSGDGTDIIARKLGASVFQSHAKLGECRQLGVDRSKGEIVALFDSDIIIPHKNWLSSAVKCFSIDKNISTVWPIIERPPWSPPVSKFFGNYARMLLNNSVKDKDGVVGGGISLFKKQYIEQVEGIDIDIHEFEDYYLAHKLKKSGYKVLYFQDPLWHDSHTTLREIVKKEFSRAKTSSTHDFVYLTGQSRSKWIQNHIIVTAQGFYQGIFHDRELTWLYAPLFVFIRGLAYLINNIMKPTQTQQ